MSGFLLHMGAVAVCPHGAPLTIIPSGSRVLVSGQPAATFADTTLVVGCLSTPPCANVQWVVPAMRVRVNGQPALLQNSTGVCMAGVAPNGPPNVIAGQTRVRGT